MQENSSNGYVSGEPFVGLGVSYMLTDHAGDARLQMDEYARLANRVVADGRQRILDWGCGFGHLAAMLDARGIDVTLYDYVPSVELASQVSLTRYPHLTATVSSEEVRLPYEDGSFDAVVSMGTLEHVQRPVDSLEEIRRVLRPGGIFYVYKLPNKTSYVEYLARKSGRYYHGALPNDQVYSRKSAQALIASKGFAVFESRYMNMLPLMSVSRRVPERYLSLVDKANRGLSAIPGLNRTATNVELVAIKTSD